MPDYREKNPKRGGLHQLMIAVVLATYHPLSLFYIPLLGTNCRFRLPVQNMQRMCDNPIWGIAWRAVNR